MYKKKVIPKVTKELSLVELCVRAMPSSSCRVFLAGLKLAVAQAELLAVLVKLLPGLKSHHIQVVRKGQYAVTTSCCAFVTVPSEAEAQILIDSLNLSSWPSLSPRPLRAEMAVPRMKDLQVPQQPLRAPEPVPPELPDPYPAPEPLEPQRAEAKAAAHDEARSKSTCSRSKKRSRSQSKKRSRSRKKRSRSRKKRSRSRRKKRSRSRRKKRSRSRSRSESSGSRASSEASRQTSQS